MALPSPWRAARSILTYRDQVNARWPNRSRASDGTVADAAHSSTSDHYPHRVPVLGGGYIVTAIDITNDPTHGVWSDLLADALITSRDWRIKYVISHGRIASNPAYSHASDNWRWRPYDGSDPHTNHMHLSVLDATQADNTAPWALPGAPTGGTSMSTLTDQIIEAWSQGIKALPSGHTVEPVEWRIRDEEWQASVNASLSSIMVSLAALATGGADPAVIADAILVNPKFEAILGRALEAAIARVRIVVDPAI